MKQPKVPWPIKLLALPLRIVYVFFRAIFKLLQITGVLFWRKVTGSTISKRDGNTLKMPIVTLRNPLTNTELVLFGMVHIGNKDYYDTVQSRIEELEQSGFQILYEMVRKSSDEELATLTKKEKAVLKTLLRITSTVRKFATLLEVVHQKDAMVIGNNWINTDMTMAELVREIAKRFVPKYKKLTLDKKKDPVIRYIVGKVVLNIEITKLFLIFQSKEKQAERRLLDEVILGGRNTIAIEEIVRFSGRNVATLWGAAHLPGIIQTLRKEYGYTLVKREWIPAFTRTYFYKDMLRDMQEQEQDE